MAVDDMIPIDAFFSKKNDSESGGKKKTAKEALASPMMRIPRMDVRVARDLIDIGIKEFYELEGRSAETIFEEIRKKRADTPFWRLPYLRLAIYFAENDIHDQAMLHPAYWDK